MIDQREKISVLRFLMTYTAREPEREKIHAVLEELIAQIKTAALPSSTIMGFSLDDLTLAAALLRENGVAPCDLKRAADNFAEAARITQTLMKTQLDKAVAEFCAAHDLNGGKA